MTNNVATQQRSVVPAVSMSSTASAHVSFDEVVPPEEIASPSEGSRVVGRPATFLESLSFAVMRSKVKSISTTKKNRPLSVTVAEIPYEKCSAPKSQYLRHIENLCPRGCKKRSSAVVCLYHMSVQFLRCLLCRGERQASGRCSQKCSQKRSTYLSARCFAF